MLTLKTGDLAFYDTFAGMIPCKVIGITGRSGPAGSNQTVRFQITAKRGAYKRGEILERWGLHVCPRGAVHGQRIRFYCVEADNV